MRKVKSSPWQPSGEGTIEGSAEVLLLSGWKMLLASEAFGQGGCLGFWIPGPLVLQDWVTKKNPCAAVSPADSQLKVWMSKYGWSADEAGQIFICSQEESIKPKNIVEKIDFDSEWYPEASGCVAQQVPFRRDPG